MFDHCTLWVEAIRGQTRTQFLHLLTRSSRIKKGVSCWATPPDLLIPSLYIVDKKKKFGSIFIAQIKRKKISFLNITVDGCVSDLFGLLPKLLRYRKFKILVPYRSPNTRRLHILTYFLPCTNLFGSHKLFPGFFFGFFIGLRSYY